MRHKPSRSAIKRAAQIRDVEQHETRRSVREGTQDAVRDARRAIRNGQRPTRHPDGEDFFGVRLSDSTDGARYVDAYDAAVAAIVRRCA